MKKVFLLFVLLSFTLVQASSDYVPYEKEAYINSPSLEEIKEIKDPIVRYCEATFLKAYMRRDFTKTENKYCSEIFAQKIEAHMNYMKSVLWDRGIY